MLIPNGNSGYWPFGPTVDFYSDFETVEPDQSIQFSGDALLDEYEIASWLWNFGDGNTSDLQSKDHYYSQPGVYTVSLTVTDENGDSETETKTDYIAVIEHYSIEVDYSQYWNLIGVPFESTSFPCSGYVEGSLYSYENGSYVNEPVDNISTGTGYWLRFDEAETCTFSGVPINELTISLTENWNLISGIIFSVPVNSIIDPDNLIIPGTIYGFDGSYVEAESLEQGYGYWVRSSGEGEITLSSSAPLTKSRFFQPPKNLNTLTLNNTILYFGKEIEVKNPLSYSLPPKPPISSEQAPSTTKDIRFSGDTKLCTSDECLIEVMSSDDVLRIDFKLHLCDWILVNEKSGEEFTLTETGVIELTGEVSELILRKSTSPQTPTEFALFPAHTNPFNPVKTIQFTLPMVETSASWRTSLQIFDITGKLVNTLIEGELESGIHSVN